MKKELIYEWIKAKLTLWGTCFVLIALQTAAYQNYDKTTDGSVDLPIWFNANANIQSIEAELKKTQGARIDVRNALGQTGLMYAINMQRFGGFGDFDVKRGGNLVELLLKYGADVNARSSKPPREEDHSFDNTPLHYISILTNNRYSVEMIDYLVDKGADINAKNSLGETPLMWTANLALLRDKALVTRTFIIDLANVNLQNNIGDTYLHILINNKDYTWVQELLNTYGSMFDLSIRNDQGWTPLEYAIKTLQPESERAIKGLRLIGINEQVNEKDILGRTGLMLAIIRNDYPFAQRQIKFNAKVNAKDTTRFGNAPLHFAVLRATNVLPFVELLLASGADPNIRSRFGDTPLHYLVEHGGSTYERNSVAQKLINAGANPNQKNGRGLSAIEIAQKKDPSFSKKLGELYAEYQEKSKKAAEDASVASEQLKEGANQAAGEGNDASKSASDENSTQNKDLSSADFEPTILI